MNSTCKICGYEARSRAGLAGHIRLAHEKPTIVESRKLELQEVLEGASGAFDEVLEERLNEHSNGLVKQIRAIVREELEDLERKKLEKYHKELERKKSKPETDKCPECGELNEKRAEAQRCWNCGAKLEWE